MRKRRPSRKMIISVDLITGQAMLIDGYRGIVESDIQAIMEKLGLDGEKFFKEIVEQMRRR